jgi:hypothetical protein
MRQNESAKQDVIVLVEDDRAGGSANLQRQGGLQILRARGRR